MPGDYDAMRAVFATAARGDRPSKLNGGELSPLFNTIVIRSTFVVYTS